MTCQVANAVPIASRIAITALALILTVGTPPAGQAAEYVIDPAHSFIQFRTQHLGISWLAGRFNRFEGSMTYNPEAGPGAQAISVTINTRSLDTNHAERDKHLRGAFFFNVEAYPTATFVSTGFAGGPEGGTLTGDLTFLGVTKSISFDVRLIGEGDGPWGGYRAGFEGTYVLKRHDFGMIYNLGPAAENVEIHMMIEAVRR